MTMTDPIADMLTRLRNANQAYHETTSMPHSKIKVGIAEILKAQGYIAASRSVEPDAGEVGKTLTAHPQVRPNRERSLAGVRRHLEAGPAGLREVHRALPKVLGGMGVAIISTSQGLLTDREAHSRSRRRRSPRLRLVSERS